MGGAGTPGARPETPGHNQLSETLRNGRDRCSKERMHRPQPGWSNTLSNSSARSPTGSACVPTLFPSVSLKSVSGAFLTQEAGRGPCRCPERRAVAGPPRPKRDTGGTKEMPQPRPLRLTCHLFGPALPDHRPAHRGTKEMPQPRPLRLTCHLFGPALPQTDSSTRPATVSKLRHQRDDAALSAPPHVPSLWLRARSRGDSSNSFPRWCRALGRCRRAGRRTGPPCSRFAAAAHGDDAHDDCDGDNGGVVVVMMIMIMIMIMMPVMLMMVAMTGPPCSRFAAARLQRWRAG